MDTKERVRTFMRENFYVASPDALTDDTSLLEQGIVDSTGILEVVAFIESTFDIQVEDAEMVPENLDTIDGIVAYVARKQDGG
ncbi:acyl carrier protein [Haliangium sp.]|uniref:acyl carrier protein n=1 Tax=Haliangium sp. TaxID=2663208 RepID=UPI003D0BDDF0